MTSAEDIEVEFVDANHAYYENGVRVLSVTQALNLAGLLDYSHIPADVLANAQRRGTLVHEMVAEINRGVDVDAVYEIPALLTPHIDAYRLFLHQSGFQVSPENIEKRRIAVISGIRVAMTPDVTGFLYGAPVVIDYKTAAQKHPAWAAQTAGYEAGLPRPERFRNYMRYSLQLLKTGKYKLNPPYEDPSDFSTFISSYTVASFKLKHRLATLN